LRGQVRNLFAANELPSMLSAEALEEVGGYKIFTHQRFQETEGSAKRRRTKARDRSESFVVPSNYVMKGDLKVETSDN